MRIEFIIPTYNRPKQLVGTIYSIINQTDPNWTIHVVADGEFEGLDEVKKHFEDYDNIRFSVIDGPHGDWGQTARNYGLQNCNQLWNVMTGDDNYYVPTFVQEFRQFMLDDKYNFIYCNMIHNWNRNQYKPIDSEIQIGRIDIGNFATRTQLARMFEIPKTETGDGTFAVLYNKRHRNSALKINKFLYVHN